MVKLTVPASIYLSICTLPIATTNWIHLLKCLYFPNISLLSEGCKTNLESDYILKSASLKRNDKTRPVHGTLENNPFRRASTSGSLVLAYEFDSIFNANNKQIISSYFRPKLSDNFLSVAVSHLQQLSRVLGLKISCLELNGGFYSVIFALNIKKYEDSSLDCGDFQLTV